MEIIIINERKNKTINLPLSKSIFVLIIIIFLAIVTLFIYGIVNFTHNKVDFKRLQHLSTENITVQKELENMERETKVLNIILDSLMQRDTILKHFASLKPLDTIIAQPSIKIDESDTLLSKNINQLSEIFKDILLRVETQYSSSQAIRSFLDNNEHLKNQLPSIPPVRGWYMRGFGYCLDPFTGLSKMHEGIDIAAPVGTPIIAPADGVVKKVENTKDFGIVIEIDHQEFLTIYGHCQRARVNQGQSVKRGDVIGYVGSSGKSTGPHLHYEIRIAGVPVDPLNYMITR